MKGTALSSFNPIQLATALLGLVFTGFLWSFTYHQMETIRLETLDASAAEQTNLVTIVTENLRQITERARLIANLTVLGSAPSASQLAALDVLLASDPVFNRISIYATSGGLIYASSPGAGQHLEADVLQ
ncbi:MAG: hypothetical protein GYB21_13000, partial [Oceanospirillales bacterium]|nr:hypothetical protein [Oceanospirillales bacterium]